MIRKPETVVFALGVCIGAVALWQALVVGSLWAAAVLAAIGSPALLLSLTGLWLVAHDPDDHYGSRR